jgi:sulfur carrier protein
VEIKVNGDTVSLPEGSSISALLEVLGMTEGRIAVEVNANIVPRSLHGSTLLNPDDAVEIVHAIGGG